MVDDADQGGAEGGDAGRERRGDADGAAPDFSIAFERFAERSLADTERVLEALIARGEIVGEAATAEDLARARVPASAGPAFVALARRFRAVTLAVADVRIELHDGAEALDALGGWRLRSSPDEIDLRLAAPGMFEAAAGSDARAGEESGVDSDVSSDMVVDATWSPRGAGGVVVHSTVVHFLVRAAVGDAI